MAASGVLVRLQQRAAQADQLIAQLRTQLRNLNQTAAAQACKTEEERLRVENDQLKGEVSNLAHRLVQAEVQNGVKQVPIPSHTASAAAVATAAAPPAGTSSPVDQEPPSKKGKAEKGKDKKPAPPPAEEKPIDVSRLDMRVGHIVNVKKHPDADSLYVEEVNLGEEQHRTVVSGLVKFVPIEQMHDRLAIFMCNLKPAKMRGILSHAMIMCGSTPEKVEVIDPPAGAVIGDRIVVEEYPGVPDAQLNPKKKVWEQIQPDLKLNDQGAPTYKGAVWKVEGKGPCKAPTMTNSPIK